MPKLKNQNETFSVIFKQCEKVLFWEKSLLFFPENLESPTNCFLCRVVLDLVMQVLDSDAGQDQVNFNFVVWEGLNPKVKYDIHLV